MERNIKISHKTSQETKLKSLFVLIGTSLNFWLPFEDCLLVLGNEAIKKKPTIYLDTGTSSTTSVTVILLKLRGKNP